jgi:hypothetical protein
MIVDYKSDSEIYTEPKAAAGGEKSLDKLKKLHLDERYLTKREQRLRDRKRTAKELLDWKKRLDEEEKEIYELEKKALKVWDHGEKGGKKKDKDTEKTKTPNKRDMKGLFKLSSVSGMGGGKEIHNKCKLWTLNDIRKRYTINVSFGL